jgi:hypothetical protein
VRGGYARAGANDRRRAADDAGRARCRGRRGPGARGAQKARGAAMCKVGRARVSPRSGSAREGVARGRNARDAASARASRPSAAGRRLGRGTGAPTRSGPVVPSTTVGSGGGMEEATATRRGVSVSTPLGQKRRRLRAGRAPSPCRFCRAPLRPPSCCRPCRSARRPRSSSRPCGSRRRPP